MVMLIFSKPLYSAISHFFYIPSFIKMGTILYFIGEITIITDINCNVFGVLLSFETAKCRKWTERCYVHITLNAQTALTLVPSKAQIIIHLKKKTNTQSVLLVVTL